MKMTKLLAGVAAAALLGGAASAYDLAITDTSAYVGINDGANPNLVAASDFAEEIDFSGGMDLDLGFAIVASALNAFTTDDVLLTLTLTNGTFDGDLVSADFEFTCATSLGISTGGQDGDTAVTLLISGIDACDAQVAADDAQISGLLPVTWDGAGPLSMASNLRTDSGGTPVDGGTDSATFGDLVDAYQVEILADTVSTTADLDATPIYTAFQGGGGFDDVLGTLELVCDNTALIAVGDTVDCTTDIADLEAVITGSFVAFSNTGGATGDTDIGGVSGTIAGDNASATFDLTASATGGAATGFGADDVTMTPDGDDAIPRSAYTISGTIDFVPALVDETFGSANLQSIDREGSAFEFPWVPGDALVAANGSTNVVRISNQSSADARLFVDVLTQSDATFTNPGTVQLTDIPAGGEVVYTSGTLTTAIGDDWGRGDLLFTVEALSGDVTARRFVTDSNGSLTELGGAEIGQDDNF